MLNKTALNFPTSAFLLAPISTILLFLQHLPVSYRVFFLKTASAAAGSAAGPD